MNIKNISTTIIIFVIVFFGFQKYAKGASSEELLTPQLGFDNSIDNELVLLLLELKTISLDSDVFSSKAFSGLKDFSTEIKPQPVGRNNPFANIGDDTDLVVETEVATSTEDNPLADTGDDTDFVVETGVATGTENN